MKFGPSRVRTALIGFIFLGSVPAQVYIPAEPLDVLTSEQSYFLGFDKSEPLLLRPHFDPDRSPYGSWSFRWRSEFFYNSTAPNLENTADLWIARGFSGFNSMNFSYWNKYIVLTFEPMVFYSQNREYYEPLRLLKFSRLNDNRPFDDTPVVTPRIREAQFYLHHRGIGIGISNANMWWGSGIHSSITMTSNTTGFRHYMLGTVHEKRIKDWGLNFRYIFSKLDKTNGSPFYSAIIMTTTLHKNPRFTLGFSRAFLSGGSLVAPGITWKEAAKLPLIFNEKTPDDKRWDETLAVYLNIDFQKAGLKLFWEFGRQNLPETSLDFARFPDHSAASVLGLRKYGLFGLKHLILGFEYINLARGKFWGTLRDPDWYSLSQFDFNSYDGRHWAAHSGPDSDDFLFLLGYLKQPYQIVFEFNYERHGIIRPQAVIYAPAGTLWQEYSGWMILEDDLYVQKLLNRFPEVKFEFRTKLGIEFGGFQYSLFYEYEIVDNYEFRSGDATPSGNFKAERRGSVVRFSVEKKLF
ncbi:MAG: hypothetical protein V3U16_05845 [Candidatus Neomarinimicrobiota bacterium]